MKVACLPFVTHRAVGVAACSLLMLVLHSSLSQRVEAAGTPKPSGNLIRVWTVGSPLSGDLPEAALPTVVQRQAEKLGYTVELETFRAAGFAAKFRQALQEHNEPEILTFDNFGIVWGITTPTGWIEGLITNEQAASSLVMVHEALAPLQLRGWVLLVKSAANHEAARALSMQPPVCGPEHDPATHSTMQPKLSQAQDTAIVAARAYLACDQSSLSAISDESRLGQKCFLPEHESQVEEVKACSVFGNDNLAFVSLVSSFAAEARTSPVNLRKYHQWVPSMALGQQSLLAVLRNQGGAWRLLTISDDPTNTTHAIPLTTPRRLRSLLDDGVAETDTPEPAQLLTADGVYPRPKQGERFGDFIWRPSPNREVVCEVAEFLVGNPSTARERTRLLFLFGREGKLSSGLLWGASARWRVWSINRAGNVTFSEQHSYARC